jgi:methylmalonic aciduria homocystinuria type C protein
VDLSRLAAAGFDLAHAFDPERVAREPGLERLAGAARRRGVLIGNTRALWPRFLAAYCADPALAAAADPLDTYTARVIAAAAPDATCYFAHLRYDGAFLPFQRLAAVVGLAALSPTRLLIHPKLGPWLALRAVVLVDGEPVACAPSPPVCRCDAACARAFETARSSDRWQLWLAVRDACPVGREHRYSDDQIRYHYTKDRAILDAAR